MRYALNVPDATIEKVVRKGFGREIHDISFVPEGETGWLYKCVDSNGMPLIIKIQKKPIQHGTLAYLALCNARYAHMPQPILNRRQKIWKRHWWYKYSLQEYIDLAPGSEIFAIDDKYLPQLGKALRDLHDMQLPPKVVSRLPKEKYRPKYLKKVQRHMKCAQYGGFRRQPEIRAVLLANKDVIDGLIARSIADGQKLREQHLPLVPVHGDVHPHNILRSKTGELYLADWEIVHMSHAEQDVMYFDDRQIGLISKGYGRDLLENRLAIEYYRHHLRLREVDFFAHYLGVKGKTPEDRQRGLEGLKETCELLAKQYRK